MKIRAPLIAALCSAAFAAPTFAADTMSHNDAKTAKDQSEHSYKAAKAQAKADEKGDIKNGALTLYTYKGDKREQMAVVR